MKVKGLAFYYSIQQIMTLCIAAVIFTCVGALDDGEIDTRGLSLWRRTMCTALKEGNNQLLHDLDVCLNLEKKNFYDAWKSCLDAVVPDSEGNFLSYHQAGCRNHDIYDKIDDCMRETGEIRSELKGKEPAAECYKDVFEKYQLEQLMRYVPDEISKEE